MERTKGAALARPRNPDARRRFLLAAIGSFVLMLSLALMPQPAFADIAGDINAWLCEQLRGICNWIFDGQVQVLASIGYDGILSEGFDQMLGNAGGTTMYDIAYGA